jgi:hypothetical protein
MAVLVEGTVYPLRDALYGAQCAGCAAELEWTCNFDADGSSWSARCCGRDYRLRTHAVEFSSEAADEDEEGEDA